MSYTIAKLREPMDIDKFRASMQPLGGDPFQAKPVPNCHLKMGDMEISFYMDLSKPGEFRYFPPKPWEAAQ